VTVNIVVSPPNVRIDQPANGASFGYDQTINFRGSAFDPQDGDVAASATWLVDGTPVGTGASLFQYRIPTQGTHTVTLSATNSAGASSSASITLNIGPATGKPTVQITSPPSGSSYSRDDLITFSASASTQDAATISDSGYSWTDDQDGPLGTGQTIQHKLTDYFCGIKEHHVTVTVTDSFGRSATDTITVNVGSIC
jgi:Bacterial Ig domain